ncbi:MAG: sulfatase-like hydrolase/transferase [Puniceicoccales bacterium]|jgi:phosphoglycerol transferase MdoB-like AlkP superfamily enzyme|nr:sulfatase-like hydrolase/transferase [Puniceicoccales bacterium]
MNERRPFIDLWKIFTISFVLILFLLQITHISFIATFPALLSHATSYNLRLCALKAFQFDCRIGGMFILPFFIISKFLPKSISFQHNLLKVFKFYIALLIFVTVALATVDIKYFKEYGNRFNFWVFNFLFDDQKAILTTIWKDYNPLGMLLFTTGISICLIVFYLKLIAHVTVTKHKFASAWLVSTVLMLIFLIIAARGSISRRPLQQKDIAMTGHQFLNKCVPNSYYALYFAWKEFSEQNSIKEIEKSLSRESLTAALQLLNAQVDSVDEFISHTSEGAKLSKKPKHIFLIVMESQDNWTLFPENSALHLCPNLSQLAKEGLYFRNFVPTGQGTLSAIAVQICNYPNMGFFINYTKNGLINCDFSVGSLFQRLGYETNFYYAGYLSWQRMDRFAPIHGYQHCYGGDAIGPSYEGNEWGVNDKDLFKFIESNFNPEIPSFNLILTASNHPPYSIDLSSEDVPLDHFAKFASSKKILKCLGHAWYADKCLGNFVKAIESLTDEAIFVITGDHFSRKHYKKSFPLLDDWSVPLVIHWKQLNGELKRYKPQPGSQVDIVRTIVELISEKGQTYKSFGKNLLSNNPFSEGYCIGATITDKFIVTNDNKAMEPISEQICQISDDERIAAISRNKAWQTIARWRFFKEDRKPFQ